MKPRFIGMEPHVRSFKPVDRVEKSVQMSDPITLDFDEFEALRLVDYEGLTQEEAAQRMKISRGTVWRCVDSARKKVISMLVEGRELIIRC
jgi:predicted DNA-binding protein (UPF0251 family)